MKVIVAAFYKVITFHKVIDIAKEICCGGFPKAYSIDVKIEEL